MTKARNSAFVTGRTDSANDATLASPAFARFWRRVRHFRRKWWVIRNYEIGLTSFFLRRGVRCEALFPYRTIINEVSAPIEKGLEKATEKDSRVPYLRRRFVLGRRNWVARQLEDRFGSAILLARVIPGLRLVTYTACGFFRLPLGPFVAWVAFAVTVWTVGLMWLGATMGVALSDALGVPAPLVVGALIVLLALGLSVLRRAVRQPVGAGGEPP